MNMNWWKRLVEVLISFGVKEAEDKLKGDDK